MKPLNAFIAAIAGLVLCGHSWAATGTAVIAGTTEDSELSGLLKFEETKEGLKITGTAENVAGGDHGFHIHEFGDCSDEGNAAGSHYNPNQKPHGHAIKDGPMKVHPGDLGNLSVKPDGTTTISILLPGVSLTSGKYNVAGRAVIIHEKKDDFGQPTGNAGGRIGCGPILITGK